MNDLRRAAEMALEALHNIDQSNNDDAIEALRQALAHDALDRMVAENQRMGLYDDAVSEEHVHKTDKRKSLSELLDSTPEVVAMRYDFDGYGYQYIDSSSGSNWQTRITDAEPLYAAPFTAPVDAVNTSQEPVCFLMETAWNYEIANWGDPNGFPVYTAPPKKEWVGLTDEEIYDYADKFLYQHGSNYGIKSFGKAIEDTLKEKNT